VATPGGIAVWFPPLRTAGRRAADVARAGRPHILLVSPSFLSIEPAMGAGVRFVSRDRCRRIGEPKSGQE